MMLPILISLSVAPGSYFFCAAAGSMLMERPSTIDASRMPRDCAMSTSLNAVGCLPIMQQSRVLALNLSSHCDFRYWHVSDMAILLRDVRSRGQSGKHVLALSFSGLDLGRAESM